MPGIFINIASKNRSGYNWEIHCQGQDIAAILPELRSANLAMKREYGGVEVMASDFYQLEREFEAINEKLNGLMLERCKIWMEMERLEIPERRAATLVISRTKS